MNKKKVLLIVAIITVIIIAVGVAVGVTVDRKKNTPYFKYKSNYYLEYQFGYIHIIGNKSDDYFGISIPESLRSYDDIVSYKSNPYDEYNELYLYIQEVILQTGRSITVSEDSIVFNGGIGAMGYHFEGTDNIADDHTGDRLYAVVKEIILHPDELQKNNMLFENVGDFDAPSTPTGMQNITLKFRTLDFSLQDSDTEFFITIGYRGKKYVPII